MGRPSSSMLIAVRPQVGPSCRIGAKFFRRHDFGDKLEHTRAKKQAFWISGYAVAHLHSASSTVLRVANIADDCDGSSGGSGTAMLAAISFDDIYVLFDGMNNVHIHFMTIAI